MGTATDMGMVTVVSDMVVSDRVVSDMVALGADLETDHSGADLVVVTDHPSGVDLGADLVVETGQLEVDLVDSVVGSVEGLGEDAVHPSGVSAPTPDLGPRDATAIVNAEGNKAAATTDAYNTKFASHCNTN